jgi:hypothetical protein
LRRRGRWRRGRVPGAVRRRPRGALLLSCAGVDPFPVPGRTSLFTFLQVAYHWWASRVAVCVRRPGDAHALWRSVVGVLRSVPVAGCMRVSGSVGRL